MAFPPLAERLLVSGDHCTVEYAVRADGTMEAKEWLESQSEDLQISFGVLFERLASTGRIVNKTQFRILRNTVWEFKRHEHRLLCVHVGRRWLLTHRIQKAGGTGKSPPREIDHAELVQNEHIALEASHNNSNNKKKGKGE